MASRRHPALPTLALAAALGATALATSAAEHAATHSAGSHGAKTSSRSIGDIEDWNSMVPEGGRQV